MSSDVRAPAVTVRYWAGARAAAGVDSEVIGLGAMGPWPVETVVGAAVRARPALGSVVSRCTFLLDGHRVGRDALVPDGATVEVLPPFAGG